jgi:hypothetical protein
VRQEIDRWQVTLADLQPLVEAAVPAVGPSPNDPGAAAAAEDPAALLADLAALATLLDDADMDAIAAYDRLRTGQSARSASLGPRLEPLDEAIGRLDFEHAAACCRQLMKDLTP